MFKTFVESVKYVFNNDTNNLKVIFHENFICFKLKKADTSFSHFLRMMDCLMYTPVIHTYVYMNLIYLHIKAHECTKCIHNFNYAIVLTDFRNWVF